jgi:polar amino acid transport system substrate-binding protein
MAAACILTIHAASLPAQEAAPRRVTVAVLRDAAPFSFQAENGEWRGAAVELWHLAADQLNIAYDLRGMDSAGLIDAVAAGTVDFGIGPITITADRLAEVQFSAPYFVTGMAIAVPEKHTRLWVLIENALSPTFLEFVAALFSLLLLVGALFWLFEHRKNPEFGGYRVHGVGRGLWLAVVTMTTVGYGDTAPRTLGGRFIATLWMLASLILVATLTGTVASLLTADRLASAITRPEDLYRVRVVTVAGTGTANLLEDQHIAAQQVASLEEAVQALLDGTADALAFDRALLKYQLQRHPSWRITITPGTFFPEFYGFVAPPGSPALRRLDEKMLRVVESPRWKMIVTHYTGNHTAVAAAHRSGSSVPK